MKYNVGILIFGDPTRGGTISSEVKFLKNLYEKNSNETEFFIITVNKTITKKIIRDQKTIYDFPHNILTVFNEDEFHKLDNLSCIVTYPGHSNFFGGYLNDNVVKMYKIGSYSTNNLKIPVFVRINDSEIKVRDYKLISRERLDTDKSESVFMKDPKNVEKAQDLCKWKTWDYSKVFWFANGSKEACDWVAETMYDREDEKYRVANRDTFVDNTIYVSDDIFFLIRKNYERFENRYSSYNVTDNKFCYIGFFDTVNIARAKALNKLFKENKLDIPVKIFGKGTEVLTKLKDRANFDIEEGFIAGDSNEYFDFLNKHLAYIFIGKGQTKARYIGKTVYDAIVARIPVVVYKKCDEKMITFKNPEFYFEDEAGLKRIFETLQDSITRSRWISQQTLEIFGKLPETSFKFSEFCIQKPDIPEKYIHSFLLTEEVDTKATINSFSLF